MGKIMKSIYLSDEGNDQDQDFNRAVDQQRYNLIQNIKHPQRFNDYELDIDAGLIIYGYEIEES